MTVQGDTQTDAPDEALLVAFANGDMQAAALLTQRLTPRALNHAARVLGDRAEAEDVAQEAMMRLWKVAREWRQGEAQVTTWLYRVVANLCTDRLRKSGRSVTLDAVAEAASADRPADVVLTDAQRTAALQDALLTLPDRQRQAVVLRHIDGLTNPEIAEVMDIGIEAVESLTARAKRSLKAQLSGRKAELGYEND